ncbi:ribonuclease III [Xylella fastidiosa subsp. sandyi]|uniref:ribonuclease III n=1 Tax=Xylella fastidiosa TaxID=2371 RepID=UPI00070829C4|nr:ribonuclease III [Xylella fastidiosa]KQH74030.1 ribonuclease 3 [Xylella fastidiosa]RWA44519.1 ribonuclease III [Xylella fastidiosa subsp. sandyi]WNY18224.1 ribonuclease III [Xylella fastidiosa]WNY20513.1 ribonuclease III [Xylella fastidiosa]
MISSKASDYQQRIGYVFTDPSLLLQALRHRSTGTPHNERLEFLGDSVVNLLIAEALFQRWPRADEGALTRARSELVRETSLASIARTMQLGEQLILGPGELKSGGHRRDSILADAVEAVIAAIYLDADLATCRTVVLPWFETALTALPVGKPEKDPKTRLQEWLQARQWSLPVYELIFESGDAHTKHFRVGCTLGELKLRTEGEGSSRRLAEQDAASHAIDQLDSNK